MLILPTSQFLREPRSLIPRMTPGNNITVNRSMILNDYACFIGSFWVEINGRKYGIQYPRGINFTTPYGGGNTTGGQSSNLFPGNHDIFLKAPLDPVSFLVIHRFESGATGTVTVSSVGDSNNYIIVNRASSFTVASGVVTSGGTGADSSYFNVALTYNEVACASIVVNNSSVRFRHINYSKGTYNSTTATVGTMIAPTTGLTLGGTAGTMFVLFERRAWSPEEQDIYSRNPYRILLPS